MESSRVPASVFVALAVSVIAYASSSILVRLAGDAAPSVSLLTLRSAFAILLLAPFCAGPLVRERSRLSARGWLALAGAAVLLALHFAFWFESLRHTSVASSTVLVSTTPLWLGAYEIVRGRTPSRTMLAAMALGVGGAALLGWTDGQGASAGANPMLGNTLAVLGAVAIAAYLLIGQRLRQRLSWGAYVWPLFTLVAGFCAAYAMLRGAPLAGLPAETYLLCLAMAVGPQIAGHGAVNYAVRFVSPLTLGLLTLLEPVGASVLAFLLWREAPSPLGLAGMALTLVGIGLAMAAQRRR